MWPLILAFSRTYAPYIVMPVAVVVGFVGYKLEWLVRSSEPTPAKTRSIAEERDMRILQENTGKDLTNVSSLKEKTFVPKTIFEHNK